MPNKINFDYNNKVKLKGKMHGKPVHLSYANTILQDAPIFPKPLEYEDIDKSFFEFVSDVIDFSAEGEKIPTFTLYSSQRFSEYSQTWKHTDKDGNLLMNFKTVHRENNPSTGNNQGGYWNIPGDRRYTLFMRTVMEDNGKECYEINSMGQPYCVDLTYKVNFVTNKFEYINRFNELINSLFKSRQCYIRPNGHYIPMILNSVEDETQYSIENRKFYVQSANIDVMAYIIKQSDFKTERIPKTPTLYMEGDNARPKPKVSIEELDDKLDRKYLKLEVEFEAWHNKVTFTIDTDMVVQEILKENVRTMRLSINRTPTYTDKGFRMNDGDDIRIRINSFDEQEQSKITFIGYDPNSTFIEGYTPENASEEPVVGEIMRVE